MKVLFAVSSEEISDMIIKKYQKDYKEIFSYKNVYYYNAIIKEIQKDKTYNRIVISEDLEPFSSNNYDNIDRFIFEKLDHVSDEAHDQYGNEIPIILISSERRQKGSEFLVKLFSLGIYNALVGQDRRMDQVCKLISRPRGKKEAKAYYKIDTDDVGYRTINENEVSELEIQNILSHFRKLGKDTDKYAESFNNIAVQYTNDQLKIIINCLPIKVKAVLEEKSSKYQEIMAVTGIPAIKGMYTNQAQLDNPGIITSNITESNNKINGPIVIPSAVKTSTFSKPLNIKTPTITKAGNSVVQGGNSITTNLKSGIPVSEMNDIPLMNFDNIQNSQMQNPNMQRPMPNGYMQNPNMQRPMPNGQMQNPNMRGPMPNGQMQNPNMQRPMPNGYMQNPNMQRPMPNCQMQNPNMQRPIQNGYMQNPNMQRPMPNGQMQNPNMQRPMPNGQMQNPNMQRPMPNGQMQNPNMQRPMQNVPVSNQNTGSESNNESNSGSTE